MIAATVGLQDSGSFEDPVFPEVCVFFRCKRALLALPFPWMFLAYTAEASTVSSTPSSYACTYREAYPSYYLPFSLEIARHRAAELDFLGAEPGAPSAPQAGIGGSEGMGSSLSFTSMAISSGFWTTSGTCPGPHAGTRLPMTFGCVVAVVAVPEACKRELRSEPNSEIRGYLFGVLTTRESYYLGSIFRGLLFS